MPTGTNRPIILPVPNSDPRYPIAQWVVRNGNLVGDAGGGSNIIKFVIVINTSVTDEQFYSMENVTVGSDVTVAIQEFTLAATTAERVNDGLSMIWHAAKTLPIGGRGFSYADICRRISSPRLIDTNFEITITYPNVLNQTVSAAAWGWIWASTADKTPPGMLRPGEATP